MNTPCPTARAPITCSATRAGPPPSRTRSQTRLHRPHQRPRPRPPLRYPTRMSPSSSSPTAKEVWFLDTSADAHARKIAGFYSQDDLERRIATHQIRRDLSTVETDRRIVNRDYQLECIERPLLRNHPRPPQPPGRNGHRNRQNPHRPPPSSSACSRPVPSPESYSSSIASPSPAKRKNAFTDHLRDYPCHVLRPGRGFDRAKRITIATLQTMIAEYPDLSPGYFDLVITGRMPPLHLRRIQRRAAPFRRHPAGPHRHALHHHHRRHPPTPKTAASSATPCASSASPPPPSATPCAKPIDAGHLVPCRIYKAMTVKTAADGGFEVARDELDWSAMDEATKAEFEELFAESDRITVDPRALERKFTIPERNRSDGARVPRLLREGLHGQGRHPPHAHVGQNHRLRRHQAPRRNPRHHVRRGTSPT